MNLGPNRLLFNNDLIKDLIFNTELSDKVKLNEIINLLFEGKPHSASREEILQMVPEFVKNNFRRIEWCEFLDLLSAFLAFFRCIPLMNFVSFLLFLLVADS